MRGADGRDVTRCQACRLHIADWGYRVAAVEAVCLRVVGGSGWGKGQRKMLPRAVVASAPRHRLQRAGLRQPQHGARPLDQTTLAQMAQHP